MQKILFSRLRPLLLLLLLLASAAPHAETEKALLWRIETPQGAVSYLFGTIHSEDPRVLALPAPVKKAFDSATTLVLEMDLAKDNSAAMGQAMRLPPGEELQNLIGGELYRQSLAAMAGRGYPEAVVNRLQPWAIVMTLSMPQPKTGLFLDYKLYRMAEEQRMEVIGLEQLDEQLEVFTSMSLEDQVGLLRDTLRDYDEFPRIFEQLLEAYLQRDLQALAELGEQSMQGSDQDLQQRVMEKMVEARNRRMLKRLLPVLERGSVFVAVGALHLTGEEGLLALLRQQGVRVTPFY